MLECILIIIIVVAICFPIAYFLGFERGWRKSEPMRAELYKIKMESKYEHYLTD